MREKDVPHSMSPNIVWKTLELRIKDNEFTQTSFKILPKEMKP